MLAGDRGLTVLGDGRGGHALHHLALELLDTGAVWISTARD